MTASDFSSRWKVPLSKSRSATLPPPFRNSQLAVMLNFDDLILSFPVNKHVHKVVLSFKNWATSGSGLPRDLRFCSQFQTIQADGYLRLLRKSGSTRILGMMSNAFGSMLKSFQVLNRPLLNWEHDGWPGLRRGVSETPEFPSQAQSNPGHV